MFNANKVLFRYRSGFYVPEPIKGEVEQNGTVLVSGVLNMMSYGYAPDDALLHALRILPAKQLGDVIVGICDVLKDSLGADKVIEPMYPNFPKQVVEMNDLDFYLRAILHYMSEGTLSFGGKKDPRPELDKVPLKKITLCNGSDIDDVFLNMMTSESILSPEDQRYLGLYLAVAFEPKLPSEIPVKETCALVECVLLRFGKEKEASKFIKNPTDLLRLMAALGNGDVSLRTTKRFHVIPRHVRRFILKQLEGMEAPLENMYQHQYLWIKAGEILHPCEAKMASKYPKTALAFDVLRNKKAPTFYSGKVEKAFLDGDVNAAVKLLSSRPGEFARRFNRVLKMCEPYTDRAKCRVVLDAFRSVAPQVSSRVLIQMYEFILNRNQESRVFRPAGGKSGFYSVTNDMDNLPRALESEIIGIIRQALFSIYANQPYMGRVYIDSALANVALPLANRENGGGFHILPSFSRIPVDPSVETLRGFIHWKNVVNEYGEEVRTDEDLSVVFLDDAFQPVSTVSYQSYKACGKKGPYAVHSGDYVNAPREEGGASEFVDVYINQCREMGIRYAAFLIQGYNGIPFEDMDDCLMGWMNRTDAEAGEVFEPSTVESMMHVIGKTCCLGFIFDVDEMMVTWVNMALTHGGVLNNAHYLMKTLIPFLKQQMTKTRFSVKDLLELHAIAHGCIVSDRDNADMVCAIDGDISPYDSDKLLALI